MINPRVKVVCLQRRSLENGSSSIFFVTLDAARWRYCRWGAARWLKAAGQNTNVLAASTYVYSLRDASFRVAMRSCSCNWVETSNVSSRRCARLEITAALPKMRSQSRGVSACSIIMQIRTTYASNNSRRCCAPCNDEDRGRARARAGIPREGGSMIRQVARGGGGRGNAGALPASFP